MDFVNTTRQTRFWFWIVFVALTICVFSWGLGYKLSLYEAPQSNSHFIVQAKLLSKNERPNTEKNQLAGDFLPPTPPQGALLWWIALPFTTFLLKIPAFGLSGFEPTISWHRRRVASLASFFFRPPPILG